MSGAINGGAVNSGAINASASAGGGAAGETFSLPPVPVVINVIYLIKADISILVYSLPYTLEAPVVLRVYEVFSISTPVQIIVGAPVLSLSAPVEINVYEVVQLSVPVRIQVYPSFYAGVGGQAVGGVVSLPAGQRQDWGLEVLLNGENVSGRLTAALTVDQEENGAAIATFSLLPAQGFVDPYSWVKAKVSIAHLQRDANGDVLYSVVIFKGIVDTPDYDPATSITQFSCTDNLQNAVIAMTRQEVDALTPLSKWSEFIFDASGNTWDYLQQRLETYPYVVELDVNLQPVVRNWQASMIDYEFTAHTVIDQSLTVSLANARDIVNSVTASLDYQYDQFREAVVELSWTDQNWFNDVYPVWLFSSIQMICDAVDAAGATFVEYPKFNVIPASQQRHSGAFVYNFMNSGDELIATEFKGLVSKRFTQSVRSSHRVTVQALDSIAEVGRIPSDRSGSMSATYNNFISDLFLLNEQVSWWASSASIGLTDGWPDMFGPLPRPLLFNGEGWTSYPMRNYTFQFASNGLSSRVNLADYDHFVEPNGTDVYSSAYEVSGPASGHLRPGTHIYDFESFLTWGTRAQKDLALDVVVAQAETEILRSHRQNRVGFQTFLLPHLRRGDTIRVNTPKVIATGVAYQIVHNYDITEGTCRTEVILALSSSKSVGIPDNLAATLIIKVPIVVKVGVSGVNPTNSKVPVVINGFQSYRQLPNHYHDGLVDPSWDGHITPFGAASSMEHKFVVEFPEIPEGDTANADVVVEGDSVDVLVPQDELLLLA